MPPRDATVTVDGYRLHYEQAGDSGPAVGLLHGGIVRDLDALDPAAVDAVYEEVHRPTAGVVLRRFRGTEITREGYRTCYLDALGDLTVPTRMLHGAYDEVVPLEWAERAAERIPEASLRVLEECAHVRTGRREKRPRR